MKEVKNMIIKKCNKYSEIWIDDIIDEEGKYPTNWICQCGKENI